MDVRSAYWQFPSALNTWSKVDLPPWLSGLMLSELQCSKPGWLFRQGVGSSHAPACRVRFSACYEIKSRAGTKGSPVSSLKCDGPSHPD